MNLLWLPGTGDEGSGPVGHLKNTVFQEVVWYAQKCNISSEWHKVMLKKWKKETSYLKRKSNIVNLPISFLSLPLSLTKYLMLKGRLYHSEKKDVIVEFYLLILQNTYLRERKGGYKVWIFI